jgi:hypothetical protein
VKWGLLVDTGSNKANGCNMSGSETYRLGVETANVYAGEEVAFGHL